MLNKELLPGIIFLLFSTVNWSQVKEIDSLTVLLNAAGRDTARVNLLLDLSNRVFRLQPDDAIVYSDEAIDLSRELGYRSGLAYALKNKGLAYYIKGEYPEVLSNWEQSLAIFRTLDDQLGVSNLVNNIGAVYFNQGSYPQALDYYLESLKVSEELGDKLRIATALTNVGAVYLSDPANHGKALECYLRALPLSEELGDLDAIGTSSVNLGEIYLEREELDSALFFFRKGMEAYGESGGNTSYALNNIGKVYMARGDYEEAMKYHQDAYDRARRIDARLEMTQSLVGLGNSHKALGFQRNDQEELSKAIDYYEKALTEAQAGRMKPEIKLASQGLYEVYRRKNAYEPALKYHEIYEAIKDSILNEENIERLALLGAEYAFEKEKQELQFESDAKLRKQRLIQYTTAAGLLVALIFMVVIVQYYRLRRIRAAEKFEAQRQLIMQDKLATLGQLTAGIAHEIKNPLNFVTNFAEGSVEMGEEFLALLSENESRLPEDQFTLLRDLAGDLRQNAQDIQENGLRADRIVQRMMEQARGNKGEAQNTDINTLIDENLNLAYHGYRANAPDFQVSMEKNYDPSLPPVEVIPQDLGRVILNIFNNACFAMHEKQGRTGSDFQPVFSVTTENRDGRAVIRLRDNGPGIPEKIREKIFRPFFTTKPTVKGNTGLGLSISRDLIIIGHNGELTVDSKEGEYTEFTISLPFQHQAPPGSRSD